MSTKRLPPLPAEVRQNYQPLRDMHARRPSPEKNPSDHHCSRMSLERRASIDLDKVEYYRGRAYRGFDGATETVVLAVYKGYVIALQHQAVRWHYNHATKRKEWLPTQEPYVRAEEAAQRKRTNIAAEHLAAKKLRQYLAETVDLAQDLLAEKKHEALASTQLTRVREQIVKLEAQLKKLRAEEKKLIKRVRKEEAA